MVKRLSSTDQNNLALTNVPTPTNGGDAVNKTYADGKAPASHTHGVADLTATGTRSSSTYLRGDNTWATIAGGGDVSGPASSIAGGVATFSGTTGKLIADSGKLLPAGDIVGTTDAQTLTNKNLTGAGNTFPTFNQNTTGSAASLTTARTFQTNLASTATASFNGTANATPGVTGTLPIGNGGTGMTSAPANRVIYSNGTNLTQDASLQFSGGTLTLGIAGGVTPGSLVMAGNNSGSMTLRPAVDAAGVVTLPAVTDTLVGKATTDILTNKSIDGSTNTVTNLGLASLSATGTKNSTTFLRGDNTWATPAGGGAGFDGDDATLTFTQTRYATALIAAANARIATADIAVIGDSSVEGHGADSWYHRVPMAIGSQIGEQGHHIVLGNINAFADKPIAFTGNAGTVAQDGTEGRGWAARNAVLRDTTGVITVTFVGDGFDMYYVAYSGGPTLNISVDGGTATVLSTSEAVTDRFKKWTGPTLTYGKHTVVITRPSGSGYAYVNSLRVFRGDRTTGVRVWDGGHAGYTTAAYLAQEAQWGPGITTIQPDLVIVSIGGNDLVDGVAPATSAANYKAIVDAIKARCTVAPQVIATLISRHGSTTQTAWDAMEVAYKAMAATEGYKWIDSTDMLPVPEAYGSMYWTDNTHLSSAGQAVHAANLVHRLAITPISSDYTQENFARAIHGSDATVPRPLASHVEWIGSVAPNNATSSDTWIDTA